VEVKDFPSLWHIHPYEKVLFGHLQPTAGWVAFVGPALHQPCPPYFLARTGLAVTDDHGGKGCSIA